jgi:hypothetical protein
MNIKPNQFFVTSLVCMAGILPTRAVVLDVASADVVGGVTVWRGIGSPSGGFLTDSGGKAGAAILGVADQQTGQNVADLVGSTAAPTFYIGYGTVSGVDHVGFRVRLNEFSTVGALKQMTYIGFDFDANGAADMFVGADLVSQQSSNWKVIIADTDNTGANTSPNTTTITYGQSITPIYSQASNGNDSLINYQQVTAANATVGGVTTTSGNADAFLTFAIPYSAFIAAIKNPSVMGASFNFTPDTSYRITAGTSQQQNNINQDAMSAMDVSFNFSSPINTSGSPVPEPSTFVIFGALLTPALIGLVRRRRRRQLGTTKTS